MLTNKMAVARYKIRTCDTHGKRPHTQVDKNRMH